MLHPKSIHLLLAEEKPQSEVSGEVVDAPKNNNEILKKNKETPRKRSETSKENNDILKQNGKIPKNSNEVPTKNNTLSEQKKSMPKIIFETPKKNTKCQLGYWECLRRKVRCLRRKSECLRRRVKCLREIAKYLRTNKNCPRKEITRMVKVEHLASPPVAFRCCWRRRFRCNF